MNSSEESLIPTIFWRCWKAANFPKKIWKKACQLGFIGLCYPEQFAGQQCGPMDQLLVTEAMCRKDSSVGIALAMADMGSDVIRILGNDAQKKRCLTPMAKGKSMSSTVCADVDQNDDGCTQGIVLTAQSGEFILNGKAQYVFNADHAALLVVQCCGPDGQTFLALNKNIEGITVRPLGKQYGLGLVLWHEVSFENVKVPKDAILGNVSQNTLDQVNTEKLIKICAMYLGLSQGAYDQALAYSKQREQFKRTLSQFQGIRHKLVDMYTALTGIKSLVYHGGQLMEQEQADLADFLVIKLQAERAALDITYEAMQIFGGTGYMIEIPVEHYYRDARMLQCLSGRSLFEKDRVARQIIGPLNAVK